MTTTPSLLERLDQGSVLCAEGYVFELERRGYLNATSYVPEVLLERPDVVAAIHRDLVHAGSDVVEALTYYAHREAVTKLGLGDRVEPMNRVALTIAKEVAEENGSLFAGNISNTNRYADDEETRAEIRAMFVEQVRWASDAGVDYVIGETFGRVEEALLALEVIKEFELPAVVTLAILRSGLTSDGVSPGEACKRLEAAGADVVGLNCLRGPNTMLPLLEEIRDAVQCHLAALPVPYRTDQDHPTFFNFRVSDGVEQASRNPFPVGLDPFLCTRTEMGEFAAAAHEIGVRYLGICCGGGPHHVRSMAEALGRMPPASRYSHDPTHEITAPDLIDDLTG